MGLAPSDGYPLRNDTELVNVRDVIIRRFQAETGRDAVLEGTGRPALAARRRLKWQAGDRDDGGHGAE
jgi:hypothetical protein